MPERSNRQTVEQFYTLLNAARVDELAALVDPNIVLEWPQSGEGIRGVENARAVMENFPDPAGHSRLDQPAQPPGPHGTT